MPDTFRITILSFGRTVPAVLKRSSRPGRYNVWPEDSERPGFPHPTRQALATGIIDFEAARRWPDHAAAIRGRPDSSD